MLIKGKRGSVEPSITTIFVVVMGITILTLGLKWIYDIFGGFQDETKQINEFSQSQIQDIFGQSEEPLYSPTTIYSVKQGDKLTIDIYLRNKVDPGGTYEFQYAINPLSFPGATNEQNVAQALTYYEQTKQLASGAGFQDLVRFNSKNLPLGDYRLEAIMHCLTDGCNMESSIIFLVEVV